MSYVTTRDSSLGDFKNFQDYLAIDDEALRLVQSLRPIVEENLDELVAGFYERIRSHADALSRFPGGEQQLARQEAALRAWLHDVFSQKNVIDRSEAQVKIGKVHLSAAVNEELMIASMNWLRCDVAKIVAESELPAGVEKVDALNALNKLFDYNLGLILTSYWRVLQDRVMRADRLILIGQYSAAINHELRNPLGVIGTSNYLLRNTIGDDPEAKHTKHLDKIDRSLERANSIIAGLLRLIRVEQPKRDSVELEQFLEEQRSVLTIPEAISLTFKVDLSSGETAMFDATLIGQVLENLVKNSIDAMEGEGQIEIELVNDQGAINIYVRDTGPGIPAEVMHQIFDPLFSTKSFGTGLGLTLSKAIVESHGGSFDLVEGLEDSGAGFRIKIPNYLNGR